MERAPDRDDDVETIRSDEPPDDTVDATERAVGGG
jgi:hypothetical protein